MSDEKKMSVKKQNGQGYFDKSNITVVLERNNQRIFDRSFTCKDFNETKVSSVLPAYSSNQKVFELPLINLMVKDCVAVIENSLKEKAIECLWTRTNLWSPQDEEAMKQKIAKNASKSDDFLTLSFYRGGKFLCSGRILLNQYPSDYRLADGTYPDRNTQDQQLFDVLKNINMTEQTKTDSTLFDDIVEIFESYMTEETDYSNVDKTIREYYGITKVLPTVAERYRDFARTK